MVCLPFNLNLIKLNPNKTMELCEREKKTLPLLLWSMWRSSHVISSLSCLEKDCGFSLSTTSRELRMCGWFYKDYFLCFITPKFPTAVIRVWSPDHHVVKSQPMFVYRAGRTRALCISTAVTKYLVPATEGEQLFRSPSSRGSVHGCFALLLGSTSERAKCVMGL